MRGRGNSDVKEQIGKSRSAFLQAKNIWASSHLTINIKIRILNSTAKHVLLCGGINQLLLRGIFWIHWPENIHSKELCILIKQPPAEDEIPQGRWRWIGHSPQKTMARTSCKALIWKPQGKGKRVRPRNTWQHYLEGETKRTGYTWGQCERLAHDRDACKAFVGGLYCSRGQR